MANIEGIVYLSVKPSRNGRSLVPTRATLRPPTATKDADEITLKVKLSVPAESFRPIDIGRIEVPENHVRHVDLEVDTQPVD